MEVFGSPSLSRSEKHLIVETAHIFNTTFDVLSTTGIEKIYGTSVFLPRSARNPTHKVDNAAKVSRDTDVFFRQRFGKNVPRFVHIRS